MADLFGYQRIRRIERALVAHYRGVVSGLAAELTLEGYERAVRIATLPEVVRGYETVKLDNVCTYLDLLAGEGVDVARLRRAIRAADVRPMP